MHDISAALAAFLIVPLSASLFYILFPWVYRLAEGWSLLANCFFRAGGIPVGVESRSVSVSVDGKNWHRFLIASDLTGIYLSRKRGMFPDLFFLFSDQLLIPFSAFQLRKEADTLCIEFVRPGMPRLMLQSSAGRQADELIAWIVRNRESG